MIRFVIDRFKVYSVKGLGFRGQLWILLRRGVLLDRKKTQQITRAVIKTVMIAIFIMFITITAVGRSVNAHRFIGAQLLSTESTAKRIIFGKHAASSHPKEHVKHIVFVFFSCLCKNIVFCKGFSSAGFSGFRVF